MTITPDWLQYGAFGILLAVLIVVSYYIRGRDKFMEAMISTNMERQDDLMNIVTKREDAHIAAWREMLLMAIAAQKETTGVLKELCTAVETHEVRQASRHSELKDRLRPGAVQPGGGNA